MAALAACTGGIPDAAVTSVVSDTMGTVVRVSWTTDEPTTGFVAFGEAGELSRRTAPVGPDTEHTALLVALAPDTEIDFQIQGDLESGEHSVTTGSLPLDVPPTEVEGEGQDHFLVLPLLAADEQYPTIVDPQGRIVWMAEDPHELQVFRSRVSRDGSGIVFSSVLERGDAAPGSKVVRMSWEGEVLVTHSVDYLTHDFVELADGTLVSLAAEFRGKGDDLLEGNKLVAISPDGTTEDLWSIWSCLDPEEHPSDDENRPATEWTHANALDYDEARDAFVLGLRNLNTLLHVDRQTGACDWAFGGVANDVDIDGPRFKYQHQFEWVEGGMFVFDNQGARGQESRVLHYDFDDAAKTATLANDLRDPDGLFTFILGDVHQFANEDVMITWGSANRADRVTAEGERLWRWRTTGSGDDDVNLGFSTLELDPGRPGATE